MHVPTGNELLGVIPTRSIVAQVWLHALAAAARGGMLLRPDHPRLTTTPQAQEAACNGLLGELVALCGVTRGDFEYNHPGGAIGAQRK